MDNKVNADTKQKKKYIKPELTEVKLAAEEAVLAVCKNGILGVCENSLPATRCDLFAPGS